MASPEIIFLQDLAVVLVVAAATAVISNRAKQPVVLGYILAGIIVGPFTPPFSLIQDQHTIETLGQLGVVFLLFGLGLHFDLKRLKAVGTTAVVAGTLQILIMIWIGFVVGQLFGLSTTDSVFLGAIISISSTVIIVKIVSEFRQQDEKWAQIAFGILIIEDILAVCILTLLSGTGGTAPPTFQALATTLGFIGLFIATAVVVGLLAVPRVIAYVAKLPSEEVLLVTALGLASALALFGTLLGFSPALGAFIMGALIAESREVKQVERLVRPVADMFSAVFFVSVGMLFDPRLLVTQWPLIIAVTLAVIGGKLVSVTFAVFITGHEPKTSLRTGFSLAQIGEFSFIIAALGLTLGVTSAPLYEVAVAVAAITAFTTPLLIRNSSRVAERAAARAPRSVITFARLYDTWVARLRSQSPGNPHWAIARKQALRAALFAAVMTEVVILGAGAIPLTQGFTLAALPWLGQGGAAFVGWALVVLGATPFGFLFLVALRRLADALVEASSPARQNGTEHRALARGVLRSAFTLAGLIGMGVAVLSVASPFVPALPLLIVVGTVLGLGTLFLYRSLAKFQARVDDVLARALGGAEVAEKLDDGGILQTIQEKYPWGIEERVVALTHGDWGVGRSISQARVRSITGATILDIERQGHKILNPPPQELMQEGDRVVLIGEPPHLEAAQGLLTRGPVSDLPGEAPPTVGEIVLGPSSPVVGATLASLHLRERTGVSVLGVVRGGKGLKDPSPGLSLQEDDVLIVLGTTQQLEEARKLAGPDSAAGGSSAEPPAAGPPGAPPTPQ